MDSAIIEGGFADPVLDAQGAFRAILDALANPGTVQTLVATTPLADSISPALVSILLTLCDHDTPIWTTPALRAVDAWDGFVAFQTGAPQIDNPNGAMFAFCGSADDLPPLAGFNQGTQEYPDRATTIVLAVPALTGGPPLVLCGPGIEAERRITPSGSPEDFVAQWRENGALFPRGVDLLLVSGSAVMGLPRTTRIEGGR